MARKAADNFVGYNFVEVDTGKVDLAKKYY